MKRVRGELRGSRGFTLVELVMASSIMAVLLVAVQSTIMLAAHAVPGANTKATALVTGSAALELLNGDVAYATAAPVRTATGLTVTVPDRNGDGMPETIVWGWDGTSGGNLTRAVNGGTAAVVAKGVQAFSLAYDTRTAAGSPTLVTSAEQLFSSATTVSGGGTSDSKVDKDHMFGQYFRPVLPANAVSWAVTQVQVYVQADDGNKKPTINMDIVTVDGTDLPTTSVLDTGTITGKDKYKWETFFFSHATGFSPQVGAAFQVWIAPTDSPLDLRTQGTVATAAGWLVKGDKGTWSTGTTDLNHYVYGTYTTPGASPTLYYLTGVRASLRTSQDTGATVRVTMRVLNEPQVGGP